MARNSYEEERVKFKKQHKELLVELDRLKKVERDYIELKSKVDAIESENAMLKEHVERMLEYCNMSEEELELVKSDIRLKGFMKEMNSIFNDLGGVFNL